MFFRRKKARLVIPESYFSQLIFFVLCSLSLSLSFLSLSLSFLSLISLISLFRSWNGPTNLKRDIFKNKRSEFWIIRTNLIQTLKNCFSNSLIWIRSKKLEGKEKKRNKEERGRTFNMRDSKASRRLGQTPFGVMHFNCSLPR